MARLQYNQEKNLSLKEIHKPVVLMVDMVNGFTKEGALADPAILEIVSQQQKMMDLLSCKNVFICDAHPPKTREFESYPSHCVIGTSQEEVISELLPYVKQVIKKNSTNAFMAPEFQTFLEEQMQWYEDIIIMGCCSDLCILQLALSLQAWANEHNKTNHRIIVCTDGIETYHIENVHDACFWNQVAIDNMKTNGITIVKEIIE